MALKPVRELYHADKPHWVGDGFLVQQLFSHMGADKGTNPFLMLDYIAPNDFKPNPGLARGIGQHPHKGFETVTLVYQGEVAHQDTAGGGGLIGPGDVQWMTAGAGIVHQEFHSPEFSRTGGTLEVVQLWVNLPACHKSTAPRYQHLPGDNIPQVRLPEEAGIVRVVAGEFDGRQGSAQTFTELNVWDMRLASGKSVVFRVPETHNLAVVVLHGKVQVNDTHTAVARQMVGFVPEGAEVSLKADEDAIILVLSGVPIDEPVVGYGPFVMNTREEIRQAMEDYHNGLFGRIPDPPIKKN